MDNGSVQCNLCLWRCKIVHGQRGFCQAHVNREGTLYNLSYGIISAIDIGRIEDKPVKHYRPGTKVMSVGSYGEKLLGSLDIINLHVTIIKKKITRRVL